MRSATKYLLTCSSDPNRANQLRIHSRQRRPVTAKDARRWPNPNSVLSVVTPTRVNDDAPPVNFRTLCPATYGQYTWNNFLLLTRPLISTISFESAQKVSRMTRSVAAGAKYSYFQPAKRSNLLRQTSSGRSQKLFNVSSTSSFTNHYPKLTREMPTSETSVMHIVNIFRDHWLNSYGIPVYLLTNSTTQFVSKCFPTMSALIEVKLLTTTAYHPQTNDQTEQFNNAILTGIRYCVVEYQRIKTLSFNR